MPPLLPNMDLNGTGYCAAFSFRMAARAVTRLFDAALQESGIRSTQFAILVAIAKKQPIPIHSLSKILFIDQTTLTRSLKLMRKEGFLTISPRSTMRQRFVTLAPKGEEALARSLPVWRKAQNRFVQSVGTKNWSELRDELERLSGLAVKLEAAEEPKDANAVKQR
jgi:DNA-binding MarR family transcriptional regulator